MAYEAHFQGYLALCELIDSVYLNSYVDFRKTTRTSNTDIELLLKCDFGDGQIPVIHAIAFLEYFTQY
jgi:hypothetical protein